MGFIDTVLFISIVFTYNLLINLLASQAYSELQYEEKMVNTSIFLILFGAIGILISKVIHERNKQLQESFVTKGLYYGGILLIITAIFANWENISQEIKLLAIAGIFGGLIWYGYKRDKTMLQKKEEEGKINEEIINELVPE